jgi:hypothetical protein
MYILISQYMKLSIRVGLTKYWLKFYKMVTAFQYKVDVMVNICKKGILTSGIEIRIIYSRYLLWTFTNYEVIIKCQFARMFQNM